MRKKKDVFPISIEMSENPVMTEISDEIKRMDINEQIIALKNKKNSNNLFFTSIIVSVIMFGLWIFVGLSNFEAYQPWLKVSVALLDSLAIVTLFIFFSMFVEKKLETRKRRELFWTLVVLALALVALSFI